MAVEQKRFNMKHYGTETPKPGAVYFASDRTAKETEPKPKCNHSLNQGTTLQRIENMIDCTVCGKTWQEIAADNSARFQAETACEHEWRSTQESYGEDADGNRGVMVTYEICTKCRARRDEL